MPPHEKRLGRYIRLTAGTSFLVFLLLSLTTGRPDDPSLFTFSSQNADHNLMGYVGATVSDFLFEVLGAGAFLPLIFLSQLLWIQLKEEKTPLRIYGGWALAFLSLPALMTGAMPAVWTTPYPPGGASGGALYEFARARLNPGGAFLLYLTVLTLAFLTVALPYLHALEERLKEKLKKRKEASREEETALAPALLPGEETSGSSSLTAQAALETEEFLDLPPLTPVATPAERIQKNRTLPENGSEESPRTQSRHRSPDGTPVTFRPSDRVLDPLPPASDATSPQFLKETEGTLTDFFRTYGVQGRMTGCQPGPVVTLFEFQPAPGIKVNRVTGLSNELSLVLKVPHIHIQVPVPGKSAVGLEVPNPRRQIVGFREIYQSPSFKAIGSPLALALGKNINGEPVAFDLARMPHLLIAGATGTGKSVCLNVLIASILMNAGPDEVRFLMIDPKRLEFAPYEGIPHLLGPVVTDPRMAATKLRLLNEEMLRRYDVMKAAGVRNIGEYRKSRPKTEWFPYIVILIDELADLMLSLKKDVEPQIIRLAQMARASGIHLVLATQRPSAQVLTGLIKANIPTKIAFQVTTQIDSRVILDQGGAELLLGAGDMLMRPPGTDGLRRLHGAYISEGEVHRIVESWSGVEPPDRDPLSRLSTNTLTAAGESAEDEESEDDDQLYTEALQIVRRQGKASTSLIQRHLRIGYNRAARLIERMEGEGIIGQQEGSRPRPVLDRNDPNGSV
ncbi:MAG: FtsK/SpoIIIE family DNA translocase [Leptospirales bacterium]